MVGAQRPPAGRAALDLAGPVLVGMVACGEAVSQPGCDAAPSEDAPRVPTPQEAAAPPVREVAAEDEQPAGVPGPEHALSAGAVASGPASSPTEHAGSIAQPDEQVLPSAAEPAAPRQAEPSDDAGETARSELPRDTDLDAALVAVGTAAREWGVRPDDLEGRFVSALMVAIRSVGEVSRAAQSDFRHLFQEARSVGGQYTDVLMMVQNVGASAR